ncbi:DUF3649 domain-containing protein [Reyranella sp. CPCC 100927]|nr:DUF3649 domain-containing protein [Reyranella sp. CPCC 100927]
MGSGYGAVAHPSRRSLRSLLRVRSNTEAIPAVKRTTQRARYRLGVASRAVAAVAGGYALSSIATVLLTLALPASRAEAVLTATMLSFLVYLGAVVWVFAAATAWRAWLGLIVPAAVLGGTAWILRMASVGGAS